MAGIGFGCRRPPSILWIIGWLLLLLLHFCTNAAAVSFTRHLYNASILENSLGMTYVVPEEKMGIFLSDPAVEVKYKIVAGDSDRFFKAESRIVGDFCFLSIRTRTGHYNVLNRERRDVYQLQIKAVVKSRGRQKLNLQAKTEVFVQILDTNDLNPIFAQYEYTVQVPEDTPLHQNILQVSASDADLGINGEVYYSLAEWSEQFAIHPTLGEIYLTQPFNYHEQHVHELRVVAEDRGPKQAGHFTFATKAHVLIEVRQVNFHDPVIELSHLPSIVEDSHVDVYAIIRATDEDEGIHGEIDKVEIISGDSNGYFQIRPGIQPNEYNVAVLKYLDRELTPFGYNLTLRVIDKGTPPRSAVKTVWVRVMDQNDHAPQFEQLDYFAEVEEISPPKTPVIRLVANDTDLGRNAQVMYEIIAGNHDKMFAINANTGLVEVDGLLDAEKQTHYELVIKATDQASSGQRKANMTNLIITIFDNNDEDPSFFDVIPEHAVKENEPVGYLVTQVTAQDRDQGDNGYVTYSIANVSPTPFSIDHFSGEIRTNALLDYETMRRVYVLKIRASDWGSKYRRQAETTVRISLINVNDNRPQFEKIDCAGYVSRRAPINTEVVVLSAIDFDSDEITYRIVSGNEDRCFEIDASTGIIRTACSLDDVRERERFINVTASDGLYFSDTMAIKFTFVIGSKHLRGGSDFVNFDCRDSGVMKQLTDMISTAEKNNLQDHDVTAQLPVRFGLNRHSPEFDGSTSHISVNESAPIGLPLITIKASDKDLGYNGQLVYVITGGNQQSSFQIDLYTGILRVAAALDREKHPHYILNITVYDLGKPQMSASKLFNVDVLDVNDNAPVFSKSTLSVAVVEDAKTGTAVAKVEATDADVGMNAAVSYSLVTDTDDFVIDGFSGAITVKQLDRERQDYYELKVQASDSSPDHPLTATALVRIQILDINDNPPHFPLASYIARVREDMPNGTVVAEIAANDPDLMEGGEVTYSIYNVDSRDTFIIDRHYGTVRLAQGLDFEKRQMYNLTIEAIDGGTPPLSSAVTLIVEVMDVNENRYAPRFNDTVVLGTIKENLPAGTFVVQVNATDDDDDSETVHYLHNRNIIYSIRDGSGVGLFSIDVEGNIYTTAVLDRETEQHYWLTVYVQDRAAVPLYSRLDVYIEVLDENDNIPQTVSPMYFQTVEEHTTAGSKVVQVEAYDLDVDVSKQLSFRITGGNLQEHFAIDSSSGVISTTSRLLDREQQDKYVLEVTVSDNGQPPLFSTTQVVVIVTDINDHGPIFSEQLYRGRIPEMISQDVDVPLFQVIAIDRDIGINAEVDYVIKEGKGNGLFKINAQTGMILSQKNFTRGQKYELMIQATDSGIPRHTSLTRVILEVIELPRYSMHPPVLHDYNQTVRVSENETVGQVITIVHAEDDDADLLWYSIIGGNSNDTFMVKQESGEVILIKPLDWETTPNFNLTFKITDGVHSTLTEIWVVVIDFNDNYPQLSEQQYVVEISESIPPSTEILQIEATDGDEDKRLFFAIRSASSPTSLKKFHVDSVTGIISTTDILDQEACHQHELIVLVKDHGNPSHFNVTRVIVIVKDHNDHAPVFLAEKFEGKIYETASLGTSVVQVLASDRDKGNNAEIDFFITAGNVGGFFGIDRRLGIISIAKELSLKSNTQMEYSMTVKAVDHGTPPLGATVPVIIILTMADNAPPKFDKAEYSTEIYENMKKDSFVINVHAVSTSTVFYEIMAGNAERYFNINPNSGILTVNHLIDFEVIKFFNLTIQGTNLVQMITTTSVLIYILDVNDNAPCFVKNYYEGNVSESVGIGSVVLVNNSFPLVVKAIDADSDINALLVYKIIEKVPQTYFTIDANSGALTVLSTLNYEYIDKYEFHIQVADKGKPRMLSEALATVVIYVNDVNDCTPEFEKEEYNTTIFLPTFKEVVVIELSSIDADSIPTILTYDIVNGNVANKFAIDSETGIISVKDETNLLRKYRLSVKVSDGKFSSISTVYVNVEPSLYSGVKFSQEKYYANIVENNVEIKTVTIVTLIGNDLDEHFHFKLLNPNSMFEIGKSSGAVSTTGRSFDRETKDTYMLIVQAQHEKHAHRLAQSTVHVNILDVNDNAPVFINLPYYVVLPVDAAEGELVAKVQAIDKDIGDNGEVRYELSDENKDFFRLNSKTGDLVLKKSLQSVIEEFTLFVSAYDKGMDPQHTDIVVTICVISHTMPIFSQHYYSALVPENIQSYSPVLSVHADSPEGRKLIYSIVKGNPQEVFAVDFNTGVIQTVDHLDYESQKLYQLTVQAIDSVSGAHSEVLVSITVEDVNDNAPTFEHPSYQINLLETLPVASSVLQLTATDNDSGVNQLVQYSLNSDNHLALDKFQIHPVSGIITVKAPLDREQTQLHHLKVIASDQGVPTLSSFTHLWVTILDVNDNPPRFEQLMYNCYLSELGVRGQFVTMVQAFDPDPSDFFKLRYIIVGGNELQCFSINSSTGIITLTSLHKFSLQSAYSLNVSVSDGVYTSYAQVKVDILSSNRHAPVFERLRSEVFFEENRPVGTLITKLLATDEDGGEFGHLMYSIQSDISEKFFAINSKTGEIFSRILFNRELCDSYEIPIIAMDGGGLTGYTLLKVSLTDVNDNAPKFKLDSYQANIPNNMRKSATIMQVHAMDEDVGPNATVEYSIYESRFSGLDTKEAFGINRETGEIYLKKNANALDNRVYQFFVRARDSGYPMQESETPVIISIIGQHDAPPKFDQRIYQYFIHENAAVGTVITTLNAHSDEQVHYAIASNAEQQGKEAFVINNGQLIVSAILDREICDAYTLTIRAETESSPPLTAFTDVVVQVMDENDNQPAFESNPYRISIAENIAEGTSILKVVAHDDDLGHNADLRYSLGPDGENLSNVFAIDSITGWITVLVPLDRENNSRYSFSVIVTDSGFPMHYAMTYVHIEIKDFNDNPPLFSQEKFNAAVNEDAMIGTVIITITTTDEDQDNSYVEYYITKGNMEGYFHIHHTGEISVYKELDREYKASYKLEITATDGIFVTTTNVFIEILDANDNAPQCLKLKYNEKILENTSVGMTILTIEATDKDEPHNSRFRYLLIGEKAEHFHVDSLGHLKVAEELDRELQSHYHLMAYVQDQDIDDWFCSADIVIQLADVNDNPPVFSQSVYSMNVPEDTEIRSLIGKVHATDRDLGENRKITYSFVTPGINIFHVDERMGLVSLAKPLDREQQALYNLTVKATDQGLPSLHSTAQLLVIVLDINDNPPEFASHIYHASVSEMAAVGTEVVRVLATSRDSGINAEIIYSIAGGNDQGKFAIDSKTGTVTVIQDLDYEKARDYFLTVQANDGGVPSLSNQASVNVTVIDVNDNTPMFGSSSYSAVVSEDAEIGQTVIQVVATDVDSPPNSQVTYYIVRGDKFGQFQINKHDGIITVQSSLDREMTFAYNIEVQAMDHGIPNLYSSVIVKIEISDVNDNPPVFSSVNQTVFLEENRPIGFLVHKFIITDADASPNGPPFSYDIKKGNKDKFHISQDGNLHTAGHFNPKSKSLYPLQVRVFDNGMPPLFSDGWVYVNIIEETSFQPVVMPLEVSVSSYLDEFPGGVLGKVKAVDKDPHDRLEFALDPKYKNVYEISSDKGILMARAGLDAGTYVLNVTVTDGKFTSFGLVTVKVNVITQQMLQHAVILRIENMTPEDFIVMYRYLFEATLRNLLSLHAYAVIIISIQPAAHVPSSKRYAGLDLDVAFAIRRAASGFFSVEQVRKALHESKTNIETAMEIKIAKIHENLCTANRCLQGTCHEKLMLDEKVVISITTEKQSFVSPQHYHRIECKCNAGYGGDKCETVVNDCAVALCPPYMLCIPDSSMKGYFCQCPDGKTGSKCTEDRNCANNNCTVKEKNPISFKGKSYARYMLVNSMDRYFTLSLRILTIQSTGCLNYAAGRVDFSILEIVNGRVQYRFNCGSGDGIVRVEHVYVNDGKWHNVLLNRYGNTAELTIDGEFSAQGSTPGHNDILNIDSNDIYFGAEVHPHPTISGYEDIRVGYVGCMDDIRIDRIGLPLRVSNGNDVALLRRFTNIEFQCVLPPDLGMCGMQPCLNGGTCKIFESDFTCYCHSRFTGARCQTDTNPCASNPCLHGGTCSNLNNDFKCNCLENLSGKRCEFGHHCNPNPCRRGGVCEEGSHGPICKCTGFQGELCQIDIDECLHNPCLNGGTCLNTVGSFICECEPNTTGALCDSLLIGSSITSNTMNITYEEIIGISATVVALILLAIIFVLIKKYRAKQTREQRQDAFDSANKDVILKNKTQDETKRSSKLSNLEATQVPLIVPPRPVSYTPSRNDSITALNNFDTVRNTADELENVPKYNPDFLQNITKNYTVNVPCNLSPSMPSNQVSESNSLHKPFWDVDHNLKESYPETKIHNDLRSTRPPRSFSLTNPSRRVSLPPDITSETHDSSAGSISVIEEAPDYHWDCSDWASNENPLPNITEVPPNEVPDTPSLYSNESNSMIATSSPFMDSCSDILDNDFCTNEPEQRSPFEPLSLGNIDYADDDGSCPFPRYDYKLHLDRYLPAYDIESENGRSGVDSTTFDGNNLSDSCANVEGLSASVAECESCKESESNPSESDVEDDVNTRPVRLFPTVCTRV